jgi:hypothetical protein
VNIIPADSFQGYKIPTNKSQNILSFKLKALSNYLRVNFSFKGSLPKAMGKKVICLY